MASACASPAAPSRLRRIARAAGWSFGAGAAGATAAGAYVYATEPGARRATRFWSVAAPILAKYRWAKFAGGAEAPTRYEELHARHAPEARALIEELGGMFVKVGQVLSVRPEVVPAAYRGEFRKLQDSAPPARWAPIQEALERELGAPLEELFEHIDREPLGAASIGQAHLVRWRGRRAVVKVRYPDAAAMMRADWWCLETLLWVIGEQEGLRMARQLHEQFRVELDYEQEAEHLRALHEGLSKAPEFAGRVVVPAPIPELTRGGVVGMEYLEGSKLEVVCRRRLEALGIDTQGRPMNEWIAAQQRGRLDAPPADGTGQQSAEASAARDPRWRRFGGALLRLLGVDAMLALVRRFADLRLRLRGGEAVGLGVIDTRELLRLMLSVHGYQVFFCPYFNADPHPGNVLLLDDGRLGLIDFGQCRHLAPEERSALAELVLAVASPADAPGADERVAAAFAATGARSRRSDERFLSTIPRLMLGRFQPEWFDTDFIKEVMRSDKMEHLPTHVIMCQRASMLLRGLCVVLQENVSVAEAWKPWAEKWLQENPPPQAVS